MDIYEGKQVIAKEEYPAGKMRRKLSLKRSITESDICQEGRESKILCSSSSKLNDSFDSFDESDWSEYQPDEESHSDSYCKDITNTRVHCKKNAMKAEKTSTSVAASNPIITENDNISKKSSGDNSSFAQILGLVKKTYKDIVGVGTLLFDDLAGTAQSVPYGQKCFVKQSSPVSLQRVYDKRNACIFCKQLKAKISRHILSQHRKEEQVKLIENLSECKVKFDKLELLRLAGNFHHNIKVLREGTGELLVARRPSIDKYIPEVSEYVPCLFCLGFYYKRQASVHIKNCKFRVSSPNDRYVERGFKVLLYATMGTSQKIMPEIVCKMKKDHIREVIENDKVILAYGELLLRKKGETQKKAISNKMRELGRIVIEANRLSNRCEELRYYVSAKHHETLVSAALNLSYEADEKKAKKRPIIYGIRVGHSLKDVCELLKVEAVKQRNNSEKEDLDDFSFLMTTKWSDEISVPKMREYMEIKSRKIPQLPITEDITKLSSHIKNNVVNLTNKLEVLKEDTTQVNKVKALWQSLAKYCLSSVILFNKRREGEASRSLLTDYTKRPNWKDLNSQEIMRSLTDSEKILSKILDQILVRGKRNKLVPILITPTVKTALDLLVSTRKMAGIYDSNPYLFPNTAMKALRGNECLKLSIDECKEIKEPGKINSTALRKYIATVAQVMDLDTNELEFLARHLGHDIAIHKKFYRLHESTIETTKVAKILLAVDEGKIHKLKGKTMESVSIQEILEGHCQPPQNRDQHENDQENNFELGESSTTSTNQLVESDYNSTELQLEPKTKRKKSKQIHKKWPETIKKKALKHFEQQIRTRKTPGKVECEEFLELTNVKDRTWKDVKSLVYNNMT